MYTENYTQKRTYERFDSAHYVLYLGEKSVKFTPAQPRMPGSEDAPAPKKISGYSYTGDRPGGGTLIKAQEATYAQFVAGLIALHYTSDAESAVHSNYLLTLGDSVHEKAEQYRQEFETYNAYRNECKANAKAVLGL